ncbi:MAG: class I SAM-dependent methyltransferase [Candidatus Limnocylindria bacterium]
MAECCDRRGHERIFSERSAEADARRYRGQGLDPTGRRIVDALVARGIAGASVLEVGGGAGALHIELLAAGAARATNVELVPAYEPAAQELLRERGLTDRIERHVLDFARYGERVDPADVVVLHRVVCCYHDMPTLVSEAARHTRRYLVLSYPTDRWWRRLDIRLENLRHRIRGVPFKAYVHDPNEIVAQAKKAGLRPLMDRSDLMWRVTLFERGS